MTCLICNGDTREWLSQPYDCKRGVVTEFSDFVWCDSCQFGAPVTYPRREDVPSFYELPQYYTHGASHFGNPSIGFMDKLLVKLAYWADKSDDPTLADIASNFSGQVRVLDIGSGGGGRLKAYAALGWSVTGVEPDAGAQSYSLPEGISILPGSAEELPAAVVGRQYDFISMNHVLEHCLDPVEALRNVRSLLTPNGIFWCEVPNSYCYHFERFNVCSEMFDSPRHLHFFTETSLRKAFGLASMHIDRVYYSGYCRHHRREWRDWEIGIYEHTKELIPWAKLARHSYTASLLLLMKSAFASRPRKYDTVGVFASGAGSVAEMRH